MNNSIVEGILEIPQVRIGLLNFAISVLDKTKDFLKFPISSQSRFSRLLLCFGSHRLPI